MISVQTNQAMFGVLNALNANAKNLNTTMQRLSTGYKINSPSDDPAGYSIMTRMNSDIGILQQARVNAQQAKTMASTADGAVTEIQKMVEQLQTLAISAASSNNTSSLASLDAQKTKLIAQIDKLVKSSVFNGVQLLDGTAGTKSFQVGKTSNSYDQISLNLGNDFSSGKIELGARTFALAQTTAGNGSVTSLTTTASTEGSVSEVYTYDVTNTAGAGDTLTVTDSLGNKSTATLSAGAAFSVTMSNGAVLTGTAAATLADSTTTGKTTVTSDTNASLTTIADAQQFINDTKSALNKIITYRSDFGATTSVLGFVESNLNTTITQLQLSVSAIRDADVAQETANKVRYDILQQVGYSMLSQANQNAQGILQLFR